MGWFTTCNDAEVLSTCAPPVADYDAPDTICLSDCLFITNNSLRADTWAWTFAGGTPAAYTSTTPDSVCWSAPGTYDIQLIVSNAAGSDTMTKTIYVDPCGVGIEENIQSDLMIYPNPANASITLAAGKEMTSAVLFDMSGKIISNHNFNTGTQHTIDTGILPVGIYAIKISFTDGTIANRRVEIIR